LLVFINQLDDGTRTSELLQGRTISAVVMDESQRAVDNVVVDEAGMDSSGLVSVTFWSHSTYMQSIDQRASIASKVYNV